MKKIVGIIGTAAVLASSIFAVDLAAKVYMTADVLSGDKDHVELFNLHSADQKDKDALVISANTDNAGAQFQFWYKYDGKSGDAHKGAYEAIDNSWETETTSGYGIKDSANQVIRVRSAYLWFKPIEALKITVGDIDVGNYKEYFDYWKAPIATAWSGDYNGYSSAALASGAGFLCELTPIDGLWIGLAGAAGTDVSSIALSWADGTADDNKFRYNAWGAGVKYDLNGLAGIPLSVGVSWRDNGKDDWKVLAIGADYGNEYAEGLYAMVNGRLRFNEGDNGKLDGITIDNYFKYSVGALKAQLRAPVTIRLADDDPSWLVWSAKVSYALDGFTPYLLIGNDLDNKGAYLFGDGASMWWGKVSPSESFGMQIKPGVSFNVGACSIDVAVKLDVLSKIDNGADHSKVGFKFAVPVELGVEF